MWKYERRKKKWLEEEYHESDIYEDVYMLRIGDSFSRVVCSIVHYIFVEDCSSSGIRIDFHPIFPEAQKIPYQDKPQSVEEAKQTVKKILLAYKIRIDNLSKEIEQIIGT